MRLQPAWEQKCVQTLHDGRSTVTEQRPHCPADCSKRRTGSCDWEDRTICRRFGGRHQQTIGPASYVVNSSDLAALTPGNFLCKYADDTYIIIPSDNVA